MPWKPDWSRETNPHASLDLLHNSIGRLLLDEHLVGYVAFQWSEAAQMSSGHLWWRRWEDPHDVVMWMEVLYPGTQHEIIDWAWDVPSAPLLEKARKGMWLTGPSDLRFGPFARAAEEIEPVPLRIEFLRGEERDRAWAQFGWEDSPPDVTAPPEVDA